MLVTDRSRRITPQGKAPGLTRPWRIGVLLLGLWTLLGLLSAGQLYILITQFQEETITLHDLLIRTLPVWQTWAVLTPLIFWITRLIHQVGVRKPVVIALGLHTVSGLLVTVIHVMLITLIVHQFNLALIEGRTLLDTFEINVTRRFHMNLITYAAVVCAWYAIRYYDQARMLRASQLEVLRVRTQLYSLQKRMHPHFLFNTLNTVGFLVRSERKNEALEMIAGLGDLLRHSLRSSEWDVVPLHHEIELVRTYLDIETVRFDNRFTVRIDIEDEVREALVPTLLLLPLIDNAVRYGMMATGGPGEIVIHGQGFGDALLLQIRDTGPGLPVIGGALDIEKGQGLRSTEERLDRLYGHAARIEVKNADEGGLLVQITLPLTFAEEKNPSLSELLG